MFIGQISQSTFLNFMSHWPVAISDLSSLPIHREGEQNIPRHSIVDVSRIDDEHPAGDSRPAHIHRAASRGNLVDSLVIADCIEVPNDISIRGGVGAQVPVDGSRESHAGNSADGGEIGRASCRERV